MLQPPNNAKQSTDPRVDAQNVPTSVGGRQPEIELPVETARPTQRLRNKRQTQRECGAGAHSSTATNRVHGVHAIGGSDDDHLHVESEVEAE